MGAATFVTQSRIASLMASLSVAVPAVTDRTSAPSVPMRSTFGLGARYPPRPCRRRTAGRERAAVAVATPCWPAPVSAIRRVLPSRRAGALAKSVVDLVRAGVGQVFALQVERGRRDRLPATTAAASPLCGWPRRVGPLGRSGSGGRRTARATRAAPTRRPGGAGPRRSRFECSRAAINVSGTKRPPKSRSIPPSTRTIGVEQARVHGCGTERPVGAVVTGRCGHADEYRDAQGILGRSLRWRDVTIASDRR